MRALVLLTVSIMMIMSDDASAIIGNRGESTVGRQTSSGGGGTLIQGEATRIDAAGGSTCEGGNENTLPLRLIMGILRENESENIRVNVTNQGGRRMAEVQFPIMMTECLSIGSPVVNRVGWDYVFTLPNTTDYSTLVGQSYTNQSNREQTILSTDLEGKTKNELFELCLRTKGILTGWGDESTLNRPTSTASYRDFKVTFPISAYNEDATSRIFYGSPRLLGGSGGYTRMYEDVSNPPSVGNCMTPENLLPSGVAYITNPRAELMALYEACRSGDRSSMRQAMRRIEDEDLGNANDLQMYMRQAMYKSMREELDGYFSSDNPFEDDEDLSPQERRRRTQWREMLQELRDIKRLEGDQRNDALRDFVTERGREYTEFLSYIQREFSDPIAENDLEELQRASRRGSTTAKRRAGNLLTEAERIVGWIDINKNNLMVEQVTRAMQEEGQFSDAEAVQRFHVSSAAHRSMASSSSRTSYRQAQQLVERGMSRYERNSRVAEDRYNIRENGATPSASLRTQASRYQSVRDRVWQNDMQYIQQQMQYCTQSSFGFLQNPTRCQYAMRNRDQWMRDAMYRRQIYNQQIGSTQQQMNLYMQWEQQAARARGISSVGGGGDFFSQFGLLGSDPYGLGGGSSSLHSLGPSSGMDMMGFSGMSGMQGGMMMPQAYNPLSGY